MVPRRFHTTINQIATIVFLQFEKKARLLTDVVIKQKFAVKKLIEYTIQASESLAGLHKQFLQMRYILFYSRRMRMACK